MKRKDHLLKDMTSKTKDLETQIGDVETETHELRAQLDGRKEAIEELSAEFREAEEEKVKLDDERRYPIIQRSLRSGSCGDLRPRHLLKRMLRRRSSGKRNSCCIIRWTGTSKQA
jgi:septal ring factor EnvC (AmiA/AmiB activator)